MPRHIFEESHNVQYKLTTNSITTKIKIILRYIYVDKWMTQAKFISLKNVKKKNTKGVKRNTYTQYSQLAYNT